ncbi:NAD(P)H dehydrogenase [quinone] 1 [Coccomyxa sp. Obi]|nr:NAD(P)H dehydrogenase [quinone] 1 [Coccomyxa sp. Obi]
MKVFLVLAHPESRSLNGSLAKYAVKILEDAGHEVKVSDLYTMKFKAVVDGDDFQEYNNVERLNIFKESLHAYKNGTQTADVIAEQEKMKWADVLILHFPLWWYGMPAILKGWVDRVYAGGFAYWVGEYTPTHQSDRFGEGTMAGKRAMCMVTTGGKAEQFSARGIAGPIDDLLWPINHGILYYTGYDVLPPFVTFDSFPGHVPPERFEQICADMKERLLTLDTVEPIAYRKQNFGDYTMPGLELKPGLEQPGETGFAIHTKKSAPSSTSA